MPGSGSAVLRVARSCFFFQNRLQHQTTRLKLQNLQQPSAVHPLKCKPSNQLSRSIVMPTKRRTRIPKIIEQLMPHPLSPYPKTHTLQGSAYLGPCAILHYSRDHATFLFSGCPSLPRNLSFTLDPQRRLKTQLIPVNIQASLSLYLYNFDCLQKPGIVHQLPLEHPEPLPDRCGEARIGRPAPAPRPQQGCYTTVDDLD